MIHYPAGQNRSYRASVKNLLPARGSRAANSRVSAQRDMSLDDGRAVTGGERGGAIPAAIWGSREDWIRAGADANTTPPAFSVVAGDPFSRNLGTLMPQPLPQGPTQPLLLDARDPLRRRISVSRRSFSRLRPDTRLYMAIMGGTARTAISLDGVFNAWRTGSAGIIAVFSRVDNCKGEREAQLQLGRPHLVGTRERSGFSSRQHSPLRMFRDEQWSR